MDDRARILCSRCRRGKSAIRCRILAYGRRGVSPGGSLGQGSAPRPGSLVGAVIERPNHALVRHDHLMARTRQQTWDEAVRNTHRHRARYGLLLALAAVA